jgi:hypothetical protein
MYIQYPKLLAYKSAEVLRDIRNDRLRDELQDRSGPGHPQQRTPKVRHGLVAIDVARIAKAEGHTSDGDCSSEEGRCKTPSKPLSNVEEPVTRNIVPADLQMHGNHAHEDCFR